MNYTIDQRKERALELRRQGCNCCQCVAMVFDDVTGLEPGAVAALTGGFGSGFGGRGDVCGTMSAATMVCGVAYAGMERKELYGKVKAVMGAFEKAEGSCVCRELKGPGRKPCTELITDAVEMVHSQLEADGK